MRMTIGRIGTTLEERVTSRRPAWMPSAPSRVADLWLDLRDRRLLPVVLLLVAAIVAVPVVLARGGEQAAPTPAPSPATQAAGPAVVPDERVLRDPEVRLRDAESRNPFSQQLPAVEESAASEAASGGQQATSVDAQVQDAIEQITSPTGAVKAEPSEVSPSGSGAVESSASPTRIADPVRVIVGNGEKRREYRLNGDEGITQKLVRKLARQVGETVRIVVPLGDGRRRVYRLELEKVTRAKQ